MAKETRQCSMCRLHLTYDHYWADRTRVGPVKLAAYCKECKKEPRRIWIEKWRREQPYEARAQSWKDQLIRQERVNAKKEAQKV